MVKGENVLPLKTLSPPSLGLLKFLAKLVVLGFCARSRSMILPGWIFLLVDSFLAVSAMRNRRADGDGGVLPVRILQECNGSLDERATMVMA